MSPPPPAPITPIPLIPGLYLSDITIPNDHSLLITHKITHVISLTSLRQCPRLDPELGIRHIHVDIDDNPYADIAMCLEGLCAWIHHTLQSEPIVESNNSQETQIQDQDSRTTNILIHCIQAQSRSPTLLITYLMRALSLPYATALSHVQEQRPDVLPNSGFGEQLRLWEDWGYTVFDAQTGEEGAKRGLKKEYLDWKEGRGILMSRAEREKEEALMERMEGLVREFGKGNS